MACTSPLTGYRARNPNENGKFPLVFSPREGSEKLDVPCGQCMSCRLSRSRIWATRIMHEVSCHEKNSFVTLTYDDDHIPTDWSLHKSDVQKFIKRLRKKIHPAKVRYYYCGEYGDLNGRPHYHLGLFGYDFSDKVLIQNAEYPLYASATLSELWPLGHSSIGNLTWDSASYIASYVTKKINGELADDHYKRYRPEIGIYWLQPEYSNMSLKPGIGYDWYDKHKEDLIKHDSIHVNGHRQALPRAYDNIRQRDQPEVFEAIKRRRQIQRELLGPTDPEQLIAKDAILKSKDKNKKGTL